MLIRRKKKYLKNCKSIQRETPEKVQQKLIICLLTFLILCLGLEYFLLINGIYELRQEFVEILLTKENLAQEISKLNSINLGLYEIESEQKQLVDFFSGKTHELIDKKVPEYPGSILVTAGFCVFLGLCYLYDIHLPR